MKRWHSPLTVTVIFLVLLVISWVVPIKTYSQAKSRVRFIDSANSAGVSRTLTAAPYFDLTNPFFKPLGINGRTCATCHPVSQGMTITPDYAVQVFGETQGLDPLFAPVDGANSPLADLSTSQARQTNCSMLLTKGLIRVGVPLSPDAEFTLADVDDPYHYASARELSCFRRPLPVTNLRFLSTVMWDGRELIGQSSIWDALAQQVKDAVHNHMQSPTPPSDTAVSQIIAFETQLYTAQIFDNSVGTLTAPPVNAGPLPLSSTPFFPGLNDAFGIARTRQPFNPNVFRFYNEWLPTPPRHAPSNPRRAAQRSVARGEQLFTHRQFLITGVAGLNDTLGRAQIIGTCSSCHSAPSVGSNALPLLLNTGIADGARRTPDMPLYLLRNKRTGLTLETTDPGAALTTGKWNDIGKFKVPSLRGLETQSPYMHNGFSGDLTDVLDFYDTRFSIALSDQEKADLKAFLTTL